MVLKCDVFLEIPPEKYLLLGEIVVLWKMAYTYFCLKKIITLIYERFLIGVSLGIFVEKLAPVAQSSVFKCWTVIALK